jgi:hypothetical protein
MKSVICFGDKFCCLQNKRIGNWELICISSVSSTKFAKFLEQFTKLKKNPNENPNKLTH